MDHTPVYCCFFCCYLLFDMIFWLVGEWTEENSLFVGDITHEAFTQSQCMGIPQPSGALYGMHYNHFKLKVEPFPVHQTNIIRRNLQQRLLRDHSLANMFIGNSHSFTVVPFLVVTPRLDSRGGGLKGGWAYSLTFNRKTSIGPCWLDRFFSHNKFCRKVSRLSMLTFPRHSNVTVVTVCTYVNITNKVKII